VKVEQGDLFSDGDEVRLAWPNVTWKCFWRPTR
jgi:hypothetical protein